MSEVHVLGIRHHGPGSARAVGEALAEIRPDAVLIEGAPELDGVAALADHRDMVPPVAGLVYAKDDPAKAVFYPLASFSPEWRALRWALAENVPVRFCDLPAAHSLILDPGEERAKGAPRVRDDPIGALAAAAGYDDPERWWEDVIEHRYHGTDLFAAVLDAMGALRQSDAEGYAASRSGQAAHRAPDAPKASPADPFTVHIERREAFMRKVIRATLAGGAERVTVICGAWHAPALVPESFPPVKDDTARLKGLPKVRVEATWVPWTSALLARRSGYGAGVDSPGWYHHLATASSEPGASDATPTRFLVNAARLLRERGHDVSPAATVDAVRLADALAALRGRPGPGLGEVLDAAEAAMAGGSYVPIRLIAKELLVGRDIGEVPDDAPMVPLARDLAAQQKRLRLPVQATPKTIELDLRNETGRLRSRLLHRLVILGVDWGELTDPGRTKGTFKEAWVLQWHPQFSVALVEASACGTTIEAAAGVALAEAAGLSEDPGELANLVEVALLGELPAALTTVTETLAARVAEQRDTARLMAAVEPLARTRRYGNVRQVDTESVSPVLAGLVTRVSIGLPAAASALDDDGAAALRPLMDSVDRAIGLLDDAALREPWFGALHALAGVPASRPDMTTAEPEPASAGSGSAAGPQPAYGALPSPTGGGGIHGLIAGRAVRILLDSGRVDIEAARRRLSQALSLADEAPHGAAWLEGFLAGDASLLLHDPALLRVVDDWVTEVRSRVFDELLPVLRRTFATFAAPDRRALGLHLRRLEEGPAGGPPDIADGLDLERADRVVPRILELLGIGGKT